MLLKRWLSTCVETSHYRAGNTDQFVFSSPAVHAIVTDGGALREYSEFLMMFHLKSCDVEVIAVADLQSEDSGRPDEAVSC